MLGDQTEMRGEKKKLVEKQECVAYASADFNAYASADFIEIDVLAR